MPAIRTRVVTDTARLSQENFAAPKSILTYRRH